MTHTPKLGRAKRRDRYVGRVVLSGEHLYTKADWGPSEAQPSPECLKDYLRLLEEWEARGRTPRAPARLPLDASTVSGLVDEYEQHLKDLGRYVRSGEETTTWMFFRPCFATWRESFGKVEPRKLLTTHLLSYRDAQEALVAGAKLLPQTVNRRLRALKHFIVWAIQRGKMPETVGWTASNLVKVKAAHHVATVEKRARKKRAVTWGEVEAVAAVSNPRYAAMLLIQRTIGCRPGELCEMVRKDVDTSSTPGFWKWTPAKHKTQHHGHSITYWLPEPAQLLLAPWLQKAKDEVFAATTELYLEATVAACRRAGVDRFTPHELRHAVATERANDPNIPLAAAGRSIGHKRLTSLQPYVHEDVEQVQRASQVS